MFILQIVSTLLMVFLLMSMMAKARPLIGLNMPGKTLQTIPLGPVSKLQMYRSSLLALLTGCVFGVTAGWLPLNIAEMIGALTFVILIMPMRYTLTTKGIGVGNVVFRPWNEFSGFSMRKSSLELASLDSLGPITLSVKPAEMDNVLKFVERHIKKDASTIL